MKGEATLQRPWLGSWPEGVPKSIDYPEISVHELLRRAATEFGGRPAITFYGRSYILRDLDAAADRFAAGLRRIGVLPGHLVSPRASEHTPFHRRFFRRAPRGGIVVQTNPCNPAGIGGPLDRRGGRDRRHTGPVLAQRLEGRANAGVKRVVVCDVGEFLKAPLRQLYPIKKRRDLKKQGHWPSTSRMKPDSPVRRPGSDASKSTSETRASLDDVAVLQYTGGTTGTSKGAML